MQLALERNRLSEPMDNYDGITAPGGGVASTDPPPSAVCQKQRVKDSFGVQGSDAWGGFLHVEMHVRDFRFHPRLSVLIQS